MQRIVQQITQHFIDRLPENEQYYRLDELRKWEFPSFVVRRIKIELERNLAESMVIPKTDWANTQSDAVLDAWQQFVDAIRAEARLPASYAQTVIETAVADVMDMLVQPRKNVPQVIFGAEDELSYEEICERVKSVVVYGHFARLIPRYMEKKELDTLSKTRCAKIVSDADRKLTARYSPLNWAQMLEPLFKLVDGAIDTNLLRLFFEDKNMPRIARQFDLMNDSLSRAELIETLSSPDLLDFQGYEDEQSNLFTDQPSSQSESPKNPSSGKNNEESTDTTTSEEKHGKEKGESSAQDTTKEEQETASGEPEDEHTLNTGFTQIQEVEPEAEDDEDNESLNAVFVENKEEAETSPDGGQVDEAGKSEREEKKNVQPTDQPQEKGEPSDIEEKEDPSPDSDTVSSPNGQESDKEETPMWMRYMSDEEIEEYKEREQEAEQEEEDDFVDEPVIDLTQDEASDRDITELEDQLSGDRELFVEEIFRGSERAFDEAVEKIAAYDNWREASKYIEKDIFKRNLVDMYSEPAVDFTDRLQSFFLEKQNRNK